MVRWIPWWLWVTAGATAAIVVARSESAVQIAVALGLSGVAMLAAVVRLRRPRIRTWQDAEAAAARWLRRAGCRRVELTGGSADGGIDVVTADWAVQVKHTAKRVGRPAVQQLVGAALTLGREPVLFSTSGFSAPAVVYADEHDVALLELALDGSATRINRRARRVGKRSRRLIRR
jgi:hypothetical protein